MSNEEKHNIAEGLFPLKIEIAKLKFDPKNARLHPEPNLIGIEDSLVRFGQRKPVVVNSITNTIEAGNGLVEAASRLGWTHVAALFVSDDPHTATGYALADNKVGETSIWDQEVLADLLRELEEFDPELIVGFGVSELDELLDRLDEDEFVDDPNSGAKKRENENDPDPEGPKEPKEGDVRRVELFVLTTDYEQFMEDLQVASKKFETDNVSSTVVRIAEYVARGGGENE